MPVVLITFLCGVGGGGEITIEEIFGVDFVATGTTSFTGDPSDSLFYAFTVENLGNGMQNKAEGKTWSGQTKAPAEPAAYPAY